MKMSLDIRDADAEVSVLSILLSAGFDSGFVEEDVYDPDEEVDENVGHVEVEEEKDDLSEDPGGLEKNSSWRSSQ